MIFQDRLDQQLTFLTEADRLKSVERSNVLLDLSRHENSAEHSWHAALFALIFADSAPKDCDLDRAIAMLLVHDLVEIDAGDHPVHIPFDAENVAQKESEAADRIFGLLPTDQGTAIRALWQEFENRETPSAIYAKRIDHIQPILQVFLAPIWREGHPDIATHTLREGRARYLNTDWPEIAQYCETLISGETPPKGDMHKRLTFLSEIDQLKHVERATTLCDGSRFENSAEHSWHVALWAMILAEHLPDGADINTAIRMLLLHDLVEIDAGDAPVFGDHDTAAIEAAEALAAERLFGLLPQTQAQDLREIWNRFEENNSPEAIFAKSLDRAIPPVQNLASGGGSWVDYKVTYDMFCTKVGAKIQRGAPAVWTWLAPRAKKLLDELVANNHQRS